MMTVFRLYETVLSAKYKSGSLLVEDSHDYNTRSRGEIALSYYRLELQYIQRNQMYIGLQLLWWNTFGIIIYVSTSEKLLNRIL